MWVQIAGEPCCVCITKIGSGRAINISKSFLIILRRNIREIIHHILKVPLFRLQIFRNEMRPLVSENRFPVLAHLTPS